jgi:hypothetical protein
MLIVYGQLFIILIIDGYSTNFVVIGGVVIFRVGVDDALIRIRSVEFLSEFLELLVKLFSRSDFDQIIKLF